MAWLLFEILVFVAAGVIFGGLIGLGLAALAAKRRVAAVSERERQGVSDEMLAAERGRRIAEARAVARGAAEAAARGDLETRLVEMEVAAADYRARAEAAERRLHVAQSPAGAPDLIATVEPLPPAGADGADPAAEAADLRGALAAAEESRGTAESALAMQAREIASLAAQLALAERVRARSESDLAVAQARTEEALRAATGLGRNADDQGDPDAQGERPPGLPGPRDGRADDLRRIRGIGPKNEGVLNTLGIYHYEQIATLTPAQVTWLDNYLRVFGRIGREDWVGQAGALLGAEPGPGDKVHPQDVGA
jgi:predicted flap endonuclease-1-like 5' DNA nuclease